LRLLPINKVSIPQCLTSFQRVLNPFLGLALAAQRLECLAFEVEQVLFADRGCRGDVSAAQDFGHFVSNLHFVIGDVIALAHQVNAHLQGSENIFTGRPNIATRDWRFIAGVQEFQRACFSIRQHAFAVHGDVVGMGEKAEAASFVG